MCTILPHYNPLKVQRSSAVGISLNNCSITISVIEKYNIQKLLYQKLIYYSKNNNYNNNKTYLTSVLYFKLINELSLVITNLKILNNSSAGLAPVITNNSIQNHK